MGSTSTEDTCDPIQDDAHTRQSGSYGQQYAS